VIGAAGCAPAPQRFSGAAAGPEGLGARINKILAAYRRRSVSWLEKLKKDTGLVLYCGKPTESSKPQ